MYIMEQVDVLMFVGTLQGDKFKVYMEQVAVVMFTSGLQFLLSEAKIWVLWVLF